jgi:hypothetical protein
VIGCVGHRASDGKVKGGGEGGWQDARLAIDASHAHPSPSRQCYTLACLHCALEGGPGLGADGGATRGRPVHRLQLKRWRDGGGGCVKPKDTKMQGIRYGLADAARQQRYILGGLLNQLADIGNRFNRHPRASVLATGHLQWVVLPLLHIVALM